MKETKRQRKLRKGMNAATFEAYSNGYSKPHVLSRGTTYVNPTNFGI